MEKSKMRSIAAMLQAAALVLVLLPGPFPGAASPALAGGRVKVVATTPIFAEIVRAVGGGRVDVKRLLPPGRDVHFYEPRPSDILKISRADLFVHGGLDLELWRGPLVEAAGKRALLPGGAGDVSCAEGIPLLEVPAGTVSRAEGDVHVYGNPHYWLDPANLEIIAANIAGRLARFDPEHAADYQAGLAAFRTRLGKETPRWKAKLAPFAGRRLAAYHKSWPYFARAYNLEVDVFLEPKPNIPPSPAHLREVVRQMGEEKIPGVLVEPFQHRAYAEQVAAGTGARVILVSQFPGGMDGEEDVFAWMDGLTSAVAAGLSGQAAGGGP